MTHENDLYGHLTGELGRRSARALSSLVSPVSSSLRTLLHTLGDRPLGERGAYLGEPVFEATFGFAQSERTMAQLAGQLLNAELVDALDGAPDNVRFGRDWHPYRHQETSFRTLLAPECRSVVVSSGTGSGKTECFMIPMLSRLADESSRQPGVPLEGVRALMIYPLNALINSQRERLASWTEPFGGRLRFCLYNGNTPESVQTRVQSTSQNEVLSRKLLRQSPPPILVTNTTMLEYMLVRASDRSILEKSQGKLQWIILDEAHTYVGSQAAELSLLLRRVVHAFGVAPGDVRFVATSATIGSGKEAESGLKRFVADLAGVPDSAVEVIPGNRVAPELSAAAVRENSPLPNADALEQLSSNARFDTLSRSAAARAIRDQLVQGACSASEIGTNLSANGEAIHSASPIRLLDLARSSTCPTSGDSFLPLRGHIFHRTQAGLWACCNPNCDGRQSELTAGDWPFGRLFFERRLSCSSCSSPCFDLVICRDCGAEYLEAQIESSDGDHLVPASLDIGDDLSLDADEVLDVAGDDELAPVEYRCRPRLVTRPEWRHGDTSAERDAKTFAMTLDGELVTSGKLTVHLIMPEVGDKNHLRCGRCKAREREPQSLFRRVRAGAPFFLNLTVPTLLEYVPELPSRAELPAGGRRTITFTDSRQGSARFALQVQQQAERQFVRSWLVHQLHAEAVAQRTPESRLAELRDNRDRLLQAIDATPALSGTLGPLLATAQQELKTAAEPSNGRLPWNRVVDMLSSARETQWMGQMWRNRGNGQWPRRRAAELCILRELMRRPRRMSSLETMGFVRLAYPALDNIKKPPTAWTRSGETLDTWRSFLKVCLDFYVRQYGAVQTDRELVRWLGTPFTLRHLLPPEEPSQKNLPAWPQLTVATPRLAALLLRVLGLDRDVAEHRSLVNGLLQDAWRDLSTDNRLLYLLASGRALRLEDSVWVELTDEVYLCPLTRRVLDTHVAGWTPYVGLDTPENTGKVTPVRFPRLPHAFWRGDQDRSIPQAERIAWLEGDPIVAEARAKGVWSEFSDRLALLSPYLQAGEHSAQQSATRLQELERRFKDGELNLLSCSTTMEMGVDIGGLSAVAMNNVPPAPANYLQRVGRAGRRRETGAIGLTLCKAVPHGQAVFMNTLWPFRTALKVPRVTLESESLVQRHLNALALARFLDAQENAEAIRLTVAWFFERQDSTDLSPADRFTQWLRRNAQSDTWLMDGLRRLVARTTLSGLNLPQLLERIARRTDDVGGPWRRELQTLLSNLKKFGGPPTDTANASAEQLSIWSRVQRHRREFLLKELSTMAFLPGHGFPVGVLPLVTTTMEQLRRERGDSTEEGRSRFHRQDYPSRSLETAILEYSPGADVVVDGLVFRSGGVALNWQVPVSASDVREIQDFNWAWRCKTCHANGSRPQRPDECPTCGGADLKAREYLVPAGFAVPVNYEATSDLSRRAYIPRRPPQLAAHTPWVGLPRPELGRYRSDPEGAVSQLSYGEYGTGYAVCLSCGRAVSEPAEVRMDELPTELRQHRRLRGGRKKDGTTQCEGPDQPFAIKRQLLLGGQRHTSLFELQLENPATGHTPNKVVALTIAAALQQELAEALGIEPSEIGWGAMAARLPNDRKTYSTMLYDTAAGGAGYVEQAPRMLAELLANTRRRLLCDVNQCDAMCHGCLLSFETQHVATEINRHTALAFLTEEFLAYFVMPDAHRVFGQDTVPEYLNLYAALRQAREARAAERARLYLTGDASEWDIRVWPALPLIHQWLADDIDVEIVIENGSRATIPPEDADFLAILGSQPGVSLRETPSVCPSGLLAEVGGSAGVRRWAVVGVGSLNADETWGSGGALVTVSVRGETLPDVGTRLDAQSLATVDRSVYRALEAGSQLDGRTSNQQLGLRLWRWLTGAVAPLATRLDGGVKLREVRFADRYLSSPVNAFLAFDAIRFLEQYSGGTAPSTSVTVETTLNRSHGKYPSCWDHDWAETNTQEEVLNHLLSHLLGRVRLRTLSRRQMQHHRELTLVWEDGASWSMRLDHGLSFLRPRAPEPFDFTRKSRSQAGMIRNMNIHVEANTRVASIFYVQPAVQP